MRIIINIAMLCLLGIAGYFSAIEIITFDTSIGLSVFTSMGIVIIINEIKRAKYDEEDEE